jgi:apolipoprotein N-acyltransferase
LAASAVSGFMLCASFPLLNWHLLVWFACAPLLVALVQEARPGRGFLLAYCAGAVFLAGTCHWFVDVVELHGGVAPILAWGILLLFVLVFAAFFGAFGLVETWVAQVSYPLALALSPFLWVAMEIARTYLITGFPWNLLGYAVQADGLRQVASFAAVYGVSFLAVTTSALVAWVWLEPRRVAPRIAVVCWAVLLVLVNWLATPAALPSGTRLAHFLQPNVPMDRESGAKWAPWQNPAPLQNLVAMSLASVEQEGKSSSAPLIIWPENPAPFYFERDPLFRGAVERMAREAKSYVVVGSVNFADQTINHPKNTALVLDPAGRVLLAYDKIHLVPFGEYVPWWAFPGLVGKITHEAGMFVPGSSYQTARTRDGGLGLFICYEAIFPQLVRKLLPAGPGVLVNISNDAWFGDTAAAFQHLNMARMRAIENRRYILRATNDGITCVIDPYGRVLDRLPRHQALTLTARFDYLDAATFYTAHGDVFAWLCIAIAAGIAGYAVVKEEREIKRQKSKGKNQK